MTCCCSDFGGAAEQQFTQKKAAQELAHYRRKGPGPTTRLLENGGRRLTGNPFRTFVHSARGMGDMIAQARFELVNRRETLSWAVDVYRRSPARS